MFSHLINYPRSSGFEFDPCHWSEEFLMKGIGIGYWYWVLGIEVWTGIGIGYWY